MEIGLPDSDYFEDTVIPKLLDADIVVLVSSLYYFGINAQLKTVIDRFYNYDHRFKDKHSIVLFAGFGSPDDMAAMKLHMTSLQNYMRWPSLGSINADDYWNFGKLHRFAKQSYDLGKGLA